MNFSFWKNLGISWAVFFTVALEANSPTPNVATQNFHTHTDTISKEQTKNSPNIIFQMSSHLNIFILLH